MAKRKSITGLRKRRRQISTAERSAVRSVAVDSSSLASTASAESPMARQLLSMRSPPSESTFLRKREADRAGPVSKGTGFLKPRVKHVSQDIIRSKWTILDGDAQAEIEELLRSVELPVLANYSSEQGKIRAQAALRSITGTLCKRLPRMPFPPKVKEISFDYERLVKDNRNLQQSLATSVAARVSLINEIEKQKFALSVARQEFETLE